MVWFHMMLTSKHTEILEHTYFRAAGQTYCGMEHELDELCFIGFMQHVGRKSFVPEPYYRLTEYGRQYCEAKYGVIDKEDQSSQCV